MHLSLLCIVHLAQLRASTPGPGDATAVGGPSSGEARTGQDSGDLASSFYCNAGARESICSDSSDSFVRITDNESNSDDGCDDFWKLNLAEDDQGRRSASAPSTLQPSLASSSQEKVRQEPECLAAHGMPGSMGGHYDCYCYHPSDMRRADQYGRSPSVYPTFEEASPANSRMLSHGASLRPPACPLSAEGVYPGAGVRSTVPEGWRQLASEQLEQCPPHLYSDVTSSFGIIDVSDDIEHVLSEMFPEEYARLVINMPKVVNNATSAKIAIQLRLNFLYMACEDEKVTYKDFVMLMSLATYYNDNIRDLIMIPTDQWAPGYSELGPARYGLTRLRDSEWLNVWLQDIPFFADSPVTPLCKNLGSCAKETIAAEVRYYRDITLPEACTYDKEYSFISILYAHDPDLFPPGRHSSILERDPSTLEDKDDAEFARRMGNALKMYDLLCERFKNSLAKRLLG